MTAVKSKYEDLGRPDSEWAEVGIDVKLCHQC